MKISRRLCSAVLALVILAAIAVIPAGASESAALDNVLLSEDFSGDLSQWIGQLAVITDGKLQLGTAGGGTVNAYLTPSTSSSWTDYILEFEADFGGLPYRGVSFRRQSNGDDYFWWFGDDGIQLIKRISGGWEVIGDTQAAKDLSGTHYYKIVVQGSTIKTYIDGALCNTAVDSTLAAGGILLFVNYDVALFDNVDVTAIVEESSIVPSNALFTDDFSGDLSQWTGTLSSVSSGRLQLGTVGGSTVNASATPTVGSAWTDYILEFDADFGGMPYRGISFRRQDNGDDYLWWFGDGNTGTRIVKRVSGGWEPIGDAQPAVALSGNHHFKLVVEGNCFQTYVDGTLYNTATDDTLTSGGFLFFVNYAAAWFDNVVVSPIQQEGQFRVAMAVADITPDNDVYLQGYEGQGESTLAQYPDNFTSDLKARILIVDNGVDRLVFLNMELISAAAEYGDHNLSTEAVDTIAQICGTDRDNVLFSNTHNHQANMWLTRREEENILQAVREAYARLAPAKIGSATVNTQFGISRGSNYTADADEPYDSLMSVVRFDNAETGEPIGLIYSVPMHNTMLGTYTSAGTRYNWLNCEFTGYASRAIEAKMAEQNPSFTAMHLNGFYGNAGPYANGRWYAKTLQEMETNGEAFAEEILAGYETIITAVADGQIKTDLVQTTIPAHKTDKSYTELFGDSDEMPLVITLGAFGDVGYVGVNYEPYSIIGARLKAESPYKTLLPASIINGWKGYLPTKEAATAYANGTYQAECDPTKSPFDADAEEAFYGKVLDAVCDMAQVQPLRLPMTAAGVQTASGTAEYTYTLSQGTALDKLVISFGQASRNDCAQDFSLLAYDGSGKLVWSKEYAGNSVNYLGEFLDGAQVATVKLCVTSRYGGGSISALEPEVWGIRFDVPGETLLTDDFSGDLSQWTSELATVTDGQLQLGTAGGGTVNALATPIAGSDWTDYVLEFDADFCAHPYRGISFRRQGNGDDYFWWFGDSNAGTQIVKRVAGGWQVISDTYESLSLSGTHHFKLVVKGNLFQAYVDDTLCNMATDDDLTTGGFLFFVNYDVALFDNVTVTAIADCLHTDMTTVTVDATCTTAGSVTVTCDDCGEVISVSEIAALGHSYAEGACTVCGASDPDYVAKFDLAGMTMSLGNSLAANFVIYSSNLDGDGYYAVITKAYANSDPVTVTIPMDQWSDYGTVGYYFTYAGVTAKEMTDVITVDVYNAEGVQVMNTYTRTIEDYCYQQLVKEEALAAPNAENLALYTDILKYGAAAQNYFDGYNADNLATARLSEAQLAYGTQEVTMTDIRQKGTGYMGSTLSLKSEISMNFVFANATIGNAAYATVSFTDHYGNPKETTVQAADFQAYSTVGQYIVVDGMGVADCFAQITVILYAEDGTVLSTNVDSVASYIARMSGADEVYPAIMKLATSAYNYFHS